MVHFEATSIGVANHTFRVVGHPCVSFQERARKFTSSAVSVIVLAKDLIAGVPFFNRNVLHVESLSVMPENPRQPSRERVATDAHALRVCLTESLP